MSSHEDMVNTANEALTRAGLIEGARVRQLQGANPGAEGWITIINPPTHFCGDGSPANGEVRVIFPGIRYPKVTYRLDSASRFIEAF